MDLNVKDTLVLESCNDLLSMACNKPCGAISITTAFSGMCLLPSSNKTELTKLLVRYSAEQVCAKGSFHWLSGIEVLIHFDDRSFGSDITYQHENSPINYKIPFFKHPSCKAHFICVNSSCPMVKMAVERHFNNIQYFIRWFCYEIF